MNNHFTTQYRQLSDDEILQLWVERSQLVENARLALHDEIRRRGLENEAKQATDRRAEPPARPLAPPVETYFGMSVPWFWFREFWLRHCTADGVEVQARVESTRQTRPAYRSAARAEMRYSYSFEGKHYTGRVVRDFLLNGKAADALVFGHEVGQTIQVRISPDHPSRSYFRSGFGWLGWVEAFLFGMVALTAWGLIFAVLVELLHR